MQQTSFSQRDCARLLNSLKLFSLSQSKEKKKKALSARELNSCANLPLPRVKGKFLPMFSILVMGKVEGREH